MLWLLDKTAALASKRRLHLNIVIADILVIHIDILGRVVWLA